MASKLFRLLTCLIFITCVYVVLLVLYTQFPVSGQSSSGRQMNSPVKTTIRSASEPRISDSTPLKIRTGKHGGTSIRFEVNTGRKRSNESLKNETKTPKQVLANPKGISLGEETKLPSQTTESDFQKIQSKGNIYVYSAYYNNLSSSTEVTVIGFGLLKALPRSVQCVFTRTVSSNVSHATGARAALNASAVPEVTTEGSVVALLDSHGRRYGAIFVHCALSSNMSRPDHVALITDKKRPPFSRLRVTYLDPARSSWQMALCLSPLHSNYSNWRQTVETLELVKMLGVDHVTAYVTNISADVKRVLTHYFKQGFTEVLTWRNPPQPVHNYGQMAAINDCMFRMRKVARMVVFTDLDEVIVPQRHSSYVAMLDHLRRHAKNPNGIAAFLFLNSFFYSEEQNVSPNGSLPLDRTSKLPSGKEGL
ncbi:hypothetical protein BaRGS_00028658 [Batillaria attramentaria]|uniref:Glycosyltransferase family 92 protein n=1 Tax=Batillaria attramentaria TaxID=370345 RepID=A0ABD0JZ50_9CAEN